MKRQWIGWRTILAAAAVLAGTGGGFYLWWNHHAQQREIARLRTAIQNLTASYPIARIVVLEQTADTEGSTQTHVRLIFVDEQGRRRGDPVETTLAGKRIYFEALLMIFGDEFVARGEKRTIAFPTRLYSEKVAPDEGTTLSILNDQGVPVIYDTPERKPDDLSDAAYRKILERFWYYANHPGQAEDYGIDVLQGEAVFTEYQVRRFYTIFVEADGGLHIRAELAWWEE
jgi:hypothetical protein